ncbi:hypothetical protein [Aurantimonas coralicida]|uniref:hypothetical protein n=1 Tax=Aurantimonas coralicida TaxID=182270 RepID=UPI001D181A13|nr:hypothetical protein [Aurantimonas coralicida]MCC4298416.1 hypothetical protein [Aurantimonas coralicida]
MKTAFGKAHASVRAGRGMTAGDWSEESGINKRTLFFAESGRTPVTIDLVAALVEPCVLTVEERCRLATGWAEAGADGHPVRYELRPGSETGHKTAAMLASFVGELTDADWDRIRFIVVDRVCRKPSEVAA